MPFAAKGVVPKLSVSEASQVLGIFYGDLFVPSCPSPKIFVDVGLAVACRIFHCVAGASLWLWPSGSMASGICIWDLHSPTKNQTRVPCIGGRLSTTGPPERSPA